MVVVLGVLVTGGVNGAKAEQIRFVQRVFKSRFFFFCYSAPTVDGVFLKKRIWKIGFVFGSLRKHNTIVVIVVVVVLIYNK